MTKQTEALKLALEALEGVLDNSPKVLDASISGGLYEVVQCRDAITAIKEALAQPVQSATDIAALIQGMEVSIDVSTGDHDAGHRLFGTVTLVQENQGGKHGLILLVQDPEPNFKAQPDYRAVKTYHEGKPVYVLQPEQEPWCMKMNGCKTKCEDCPDEAAQPPLTVQPAQEPLEYWNAVEGWVKIDEVREHFGSVGCGTIYKTAGEDRVPLYTNPPQQEPHNFCPRCGKRLFGMAFAAGGIHTCTPPEGGHQ